MSHQLRTAAGRTVESAPGRTTHHSFSFGPHYEPDNVMFGPLVCHNDDLLTPGAGYAEHPHSDVEIVTWVLSGALVHTDSLGHHTTLHPGTVQVQSAGSGIRHSEVADPASGPTRFIQTWLRPDAWDLPPARHVATGQQTGLDTDSGLVPVVGGSGLPVASAGTQLRVGHLGPGTEVRLPDARGVHLFVASGEASVDTQNGPVALGPGDALRLVDEAQAPLRARSACELLVWSFG